MLIQLFMNSISLIALTLLLGCNNLTDHIENQVDRNIETSKAEMNAEVQRAKEDFTARLRMAIQNELDNSNMRKLYELQFSIVSTDSYLDSLKKEMDKLDENDVRNVDFVRATFVYKGVGDSIIKKVKGSILTALNAAKSERQKSEIKSASDSLFWEPSVDTWKEETFGLTNPPGASMIIYGLQTEIYRIGVKALVDK